MFVYGFELNRIETFRYWVGQMYSAEESVSPMKIGEIQRRWEKVWGSAGNGVEEENLVLMDIIPSQWIDAGRGLSIFAEGDRIIFGVELRCIADKCFDIERYGRIYHGIFTAIGLCEESRILLTKSPMLYVLSKVRGGDLGDGADGGAGF